MISIEEMNSAISDCSICQLAITEGEDLVLTHCEHAFHEQCLKPWMHMRTCPNCRNELRTPRKVSRPPHPPRLPNNLMLPLKKSWQEICPGVYFWNEPDQQKELADAVELTKYLDPFGNNEWADARYQLFRQDRITSGTVQFLVLRSHVLHKIGAVKTEVNGNPRGKCGVKSFEIMADYVTVLSKLFEDKFSVSFGRVRQRRLVRKLKANSNLVSLQEQYSAYHFKLEKFQYYVAGAINRIIGRVGWWNKFWFKVFGGVERCNQVWLRFNSEVENRRTWKDIGLTRSKLLSDLIMST